MSFGWFELADEVARTAEASVYHCRHRPTYRTYLLRIGPAGEVPRNAAIEQNNVQATVAATSALYPGRYLTTGRAETDEDYVLQEYYGVLDDRHLVPVSAVYRTRGALRFDALLEVPTLLVRISPFWENLWLLLLAETGLLADGSVSLEVWDARWRALVRQSELGAHLLRDLPQNVDDRLAAHIAAYVDDAELGPGPALEESVAVRLLVGVVADMFTEREIEASLACPFFRLNVTVHDLHYAVALMHLLQPQPWLVQSPLEWLGPTMLALPAVVDGLARQPAAFPADADAFEAAPAADDSSLARFASFVQDPERTVRPYVALERA